MSILAKTIAAAAFSLGAALVMTGPASAEVIEIEMLNYDRDDPTKVMVFQPEIVRAQPGDTIRWVAVDPLHNAASIAGMIPAGAKAWNSPLSENFEYTVTENGTYGYMCTPHAALGMAGLILVGDHTVNLDAARSVAHQGMVQTKFDALFAAIQEHAGAAQPQPEHEETAWLSNPSAR